MTTTMVHMADHRWTSEALHLACALARNNQAEVALVRMMPVQHIAWLGTDFGNTPVTSQEYERLQEYQATAEDYGVDLSVQSMQYITLPEALVEAADHLGASVVFASLPKSHFPYW